MSNIQLRSVLFVCGLRFFLLLSSSSSSSSSLRRPQSAAHYRGSGALCSSASIFPYIFIYIYYYAEAAITLYTNKLHTHTSRINKTKLSLIECHTTMGGRDARGRITGWITVKAGRSLSSVSRNHRSSTSAKTRRVLLLQNWYC